MTVRDATRRESPNGHVLFIEELRKHLGVSFDAGEDSPSAEPPKTRPEVLLMGHDMHGDFKNMEKDGIDLQRHFDYAGCVDTHVFIEDTGASMGKSLSSLVSYYDLAELELKKPRCSKLPAKFVFVGAHCSGNDAIKTLEVGLAQALDPNLRTAGRSSVGEENLPADWFAKPLQGMNMNMVLLAYDTEGVESPNYKPNVLNRTSEHGFAWLHIADIAHIAPGEGGRNWRPMIRARHWINQDFRNFSNKFYCVGNPNGFWPEYGKSQYYHVSEGPTPFHRLFEELASATASAVKSSDPVEEATTLLEKTTLEENSSMFDDDVVGARGSSPFHRGNPTRSGGRRSFRRGTFAQGNQNLTRIRGNGPNSGTNSAWNEGFMTSNRGTGPRYRGNSGRGRGRMPSNRGNDQSRGP